ncbi:histone H3 K4-specific methyltransferase SET7/9 family protein [Abeliophyllum distichum]|uniref:Histone H3 K4-specific methyltransferase SET7/9 family protein n=1 Tax=Abeliophyllum distichum TaxID=126358 RepID=A0ABD1PE66_9LAMI
MLCRNGDRYAREYFGDKIHGLGVYHFANGHFYEGSWHEGRKQGYGIHTFLSGEMRCDKWNSGNLRTPLPPLMDTVLQVVLPSRKTVERAIHLRQVDEQVNKVANRVSTAVRVADVKAVQDRIDGKFCDL